MNSFYNVFLLSHLVFLICLFVCLNSEGAVAAVNHAFPCSALHDVKDHLKV